MRESSDGFLSANPPSSAAAASASICANDDDDDGAKRGDSLRDAGFDDADGRCTDDRSESSAELSDADDDMPLAGAAAAVGVMVCV